jgi:hypothetical protein
LPNDFGTEAILFRLSEPVIPESTQRSHSKASFRFSEAAVREVGVQTAERHSGQQLHASGQSLMQRRDL